MESDRSPSLWARPRGRRPRARQADGPHYIAASTLFLFVAGLLGMLLRESQADFVRIEPASSTP